MTIDDAELLAFVDGELDAARSAEIEAAMAADPVLAERVGRHAALKSGLARAYAPVLEEPTPERLLRAVEGGGRVVDLGAARAKRRGAGPPLWAAMAASVAVGVFAGVGFMRLTPQPLVTAGAGGLSAHGALAHALDDQLAAGGGAAPIRIGLSFVARDGRYCRTFQTARASGMAGVACRSADGWRLALATAAPGQAPGTAYRTAASEIPPAVLDQVQDMIVGQPLDRRQEAAAKARGWLSPPPRPAPP